MIQEQIAKHECLIRSNEQNLEMYGMLLMVLGECPKTFQRSRSAKAHISHSRFMIQIFKSLADKNIPRARVAINCMKANASDVEDSMSELVALGQYTEQDYVTHMNRFRDEIKQWEPLL